MLRLFGNRGQESVDAWTESLRGLPTAARDGAWRLRSRARPHRPIGGWAASNNWRPGASTSCGVESRAGWREKKAPVADRVRDLLLQWDASCVLSAGNTHTARGTKNASTPNWLPLANGSTLCFHGAPAGMEIPSTPSPLRRQHDVIHPHLHVDESAAALRRDATSRVASSKPTRPQARRHRRADGEVNLAQPFTDIQAYQTSTFPGN